MAHDSAETKDYASSEKNLISAESSDGLRTDESNKQPSVYTEHLRSDTPRNVALPIEMLEKLYLSPPTRDKVNWRQTLPSPTPIALVGLLLSLSPLACDLMGWRGAGTSGAAGIGAYYFFGGLLMSLGGILEYFHSHAFASIVFLSYGSFWLTLASTLQPSFNAYGAFAPSDSAPSTGLNTQAFTASMAFFFLFITILTFVFLICSIRTNIVYVIIFFTLTLAYALVAAMYWYEAAAAATAAPGKSKKMDVAHGCRTAAGALFFTSILAAWWIFASVMLEIVGLPITIPVGDLSQVIGPRQRDKSAV